MTKSQKVWVTPELIILVRSKPEEAVLDACKASSSGTGASGHNSGCGLICAPCDVWSAT